MSSQKAVDMKLPLFAR